MGITGNFGILEQMGIKSRFRKSQTFFKEVEGKVKYFLSKSDVPKLKIYSNMNICLHISAPF